MPGLQSFNVHGVAEPDLSRVSVCACVIPHMQATQTSKLSILRGVAMKHPLNCHFNLYTFF